MPGFSDYMEKAVLDAVTRKAAFPSYTALYLALCTVAVTDSDTGATITEANYTGYARLQIPAADWTAAAGAAATVTTAAQKQFADCTAGSSTVIGWALCTAATGGNVVMYGTCPSVTISPTQTPATIAAGALTLGID